MRCFITGMSHEQLHVLERHAESLGHWINGERRKPPLYVLTICDADIIFSGVGIPTTSWKLDHPMLDIFKSCSSHHIRQSERSAQIFYVTQAVEKSRAPLSKGVFCMMLSFFTLNCQASVLTFSEGVIIRLRLKIKLDHLTPSSGFSNSIHVS